MFPAMYELDLECGHKGKSRGIPEEGVKVFCWEWGCLQWRSIEGGTELAVDGEAPIDA